MNATANSLTPESVAIIEQIALLPLTPIMQQMLEDPAEDAPATRLILDARIRRYWQNNGRPSHCPRVAQ